MKEKWRRLSCGDLACCVGVLVVTHRAELATVLATK